MNNNNIIISHVLRDSCSIEILSHSFWTTISFSHEIILYENEYSGATDTIIIMLSLELTNSYATDDVIIIV